MLPQREILCHVICSEQQFGKMQRLVSGVSDEVNASPYPLQLVQVWAPASWWQNGQNVNKMEGKKREKHGRLKIKTRLCVNILNGCIFFRHVLPALIKRV